MNVLSLLSKLKSTRYESHFLINRTWQYDFSSQSFNLRNHKISGAMSFRQMTLKWRCLPIMHSNMLGENQTAYQKKHLNYQAQFAYCFDMQICCKVPVVHRSRSFSSQCVCSDGCPEDSILALYTLVCYHRI